MASQLMDGRMYSPLYAALSLTENVFSVPFGRSKQYIALSSRMSMYSYPDAVAASPAPYSLSLNISHPEATGMESASDDMSRVPELYVTVTDALKSVHWIRFSGATGLPPRAVQETLRAMSDEKAGMASSAAGFSLVVTMA